jgi:hypothetical protein
MKHKLSAQQRRYYRGVVVPAILDFYCANPDKLVGDILDMMKVSFTPSFVHDLLKAMYNKGQSTNDLVLPPTDWLTALRAAYASRIDIPPPNEPPADQLIIGKKY